MATAKRLEELNAAIDKLWREAVEKGMCTEEEAKALREQFDELAFAELRSEITEDDARLLVRNLADKGRNQS